MSNLYRNTNYVAEMFAVTEWTVREWLKANKFPNAIKINGQWKIPQSDIDALAHKTYGA